LIFTSEIQGVRVLIFCWVTRFALTPTYGFIDRAVVASSLAQFYQATKRKLNQS